jgi:hypothetical protein
MKLPYLFTAEFADGATLTQGADDISMIYDECRTEVDYHTANVGAFKRYPEDEEREQWKRACKSAFYDVLNYPSPVVKFTLVNVGDPSDTYAVDLRTGHFFVGGKEVRMHGFDDMPIREVDLYYTRIKQKDLQLAASGEMQQLDERFESFRLGWRGIGPKGPFERIMEIDV